VKIFITGASGFIGKHLTDYLLNKGHKVTAVARSSDRKLIRHENFHYISADTTQGGMWQEALQGKDAIVNLAGISIFKRWTPTNKKRIYDSRILTTRNLVESLPPDNGVVFCSTSAVGCYGNRGDDLLTEREPFGTDFLAGVSRDWEAEAFTAKDKGLRVVAMRFGIVLGKNGGAMEKMVPPFRFFMGGPLGNGMQWFPWIHIDDLMSAIMFVVENKDINGAVNFCSPNPVRNRELAKTLGHILKKPALIPAPAFFIRLFLGELGSSFLSSQRTVPDKLLAYGFNFRYPDIKEAVRNILES
jgi:uncharacterized protein (TIGR01777 family)